MSGWTAEKAWREECGVFGAVGVAHAAEVVGLGLHALQHRGQESAGIVSCDERGEFHSHKGLGLVSDVFDDALLARLPGSLAIGHNRYSTSGSVTLENTQPLRVVYRGGPLALAHNGNLVNARELRQGLEGSGSIFQTTLDTEIFLHLMALSRADAPAEGLIEAARQVRGAYSLVVLTGGTVLALRDAHGFRPLCIGRLGDGYVVASETCALDLVGADYVREVEPGELVRLDSRGMRTERVFPVADPPQHCIFEHIYFSRPDSHVFGEGVDRARRRIGHRLAEEHPTDADVVIAVPDSSNSIALGYAERSGLRFELGLIRNHYVGRTFIQPHQAGRDSSVRVKFNPVREILEGQRVVVVDDSIVRGTTSRKLVRLLRRAGAREVHFRVGSPPVTHPCFYGIDTPSRRELIGALKTVQEIRDFLGVDTLGYLSLEGLLACEREPARYCRACFTGDYPVEVDPTAGKLAIEDLHRVVG
ncbi:MAG: amidophosphoribosyltransferase [Candidatus Eisenbacteria bacterium RBG_16_71_46]|nr:MAG: amidophosphoribosyltransferase [Candidatus Eisenbacteria bacterium RBG_16_71_46]OGF21161.1 MAG: amidophosphoribosyltransferase [Candidatus Eisenbacteria bacterium RBG_19FT_COMBO_70_11]